MDEIKRNYERFYFSVTIMYLYPGSHFLAPFNHNGILLRMPRNLWVVVYQAVGELNGDGRVVCRVGIQRH